MEDKKQPIIIKKINKGGHGHHGGAWKVAMADFAIAMMAFFMVMWLLGGTTVEQKAAISTYFKNPSLTEGKSHVAAQGQMGPGGASTSMIKLGGTMELPKGEGQRPLEKSHDYSQKDLSARPNKNRKKAANSMLAQSETIMYRSLSHKIGQIFKQKTLKKFKDQVLLDISDEGLRIQIVDKENRAMFASGSSTLKVYTEKLLSEISKVIKNIPSKISITGHTDATPYLSRIDYSNWELSADRANAARRALIGAGLPSGKVARVVGLGSTVLFDKKNPKSALNRRISIIVLNSKSLASLQKHHERQDKSGLHWTHNKASDPAAIPPQRISNDEPSKTTRSHNAQSANQDVKQDSPTQTAKTGTNAKTPGKHPDSKAGRKTRFKLPKLNLPPIIDPKLLPNQ